MITSCLEVLQADIPLVCRTSSRCSREIDLGPAGSVRRTAWCLRTTSIACLQAGSAAWTAACEDEPDTVRPHCHPSAAVLNESRRTQRADSDRPVASGTGSSGAYVSSESDDFRGVRVWEKDALDKGPVLVGDTDGEPMTINAGDLVAEHINSDEGERRPSGRVR